MSETALSVEGGYQETNIAQHTYSETLRGLCENIPKEGDVGRVIYFASLRSRITVQTEHSVRAGRGTSLAGSGFSNKEQSKMIKCGCMFI